MFWIAQLVGPKAKELSLLVDKKNTPLVLHNKTELLKTITTSNHVNSKFMPWYDKAPNQIRFAIVKSRLQKTPNLFDWQIYKNYQFKSMKNNTKFWRSLTDMKGRFRLVDLRSRDRFPHQGLGIIVTDTIVKIVPGIALNCIETYWAVDGLGKVIVDSIMTANLCVSFTTILLILIINLISLVYFKISNSNSIISCLLCNWISLTDKINDTSA